MWISFERMLKLADQLNNAINLGNKKQKKTKKNKT